MIFATPEEAALACDHISPGTRVIARAEASRNAAIILLDRRWAQPDRVLCHRLDDGWVDAGSGSGGTSWSLVDDGSDVGVLVSRGRAEPGPTAVMVTLMP